MKTLNVNKKYKIMTKMISQNRTKICKINLNHKKVSLVKNSNSNKTSSTNNNAYNQSQK